MLAVVVVEEASSAGSTAVACVSVGCVAWFSDGVAAVVVVVAAVLCSVVWVDVDV